ncbi:MAG: fumarylacetoacetate hydrolase family protein [Ilumatobacter sp.]|nr:fumarylacetoacetate hydrolase family protein [Ilumatobacter sp.]MDJ0768485.1 fumarylacetoacetate hydrolase family protein [Ilumatobacter sp.]
MTRLPLARMAEIADEGARTGTAIAQFTNDHELDVPDAYAVQALSISRRVARGERVVGVKMGLTSRAKMAQVGVDEVIWGRLTDGMLLADGAPLSLGGYVHPRVEPEIAFLIERPLGGRVTAMQAMDAVGAVAAAAEVIDSRYEDFKFALPDVIADNSSSSGIVVGAWCDPSTPIDNLGIALSVDGRNQEVGSSAAILGDPVRSLVEAARMVAEAGLQLEPGWIVLAGGATAAVPLVAGSSYRVTVESLGRVGFTVTE